MRGPTERQRWQIEKYMDADLDTLWITVGLAVRKPSGEQSDLDAARKTGQEWFESRKDELYATICKDWQYAEKIKEEWYQDIYNLTFAIGEYIKDRIALQAPLPVASLLVRFGLETPCGME